jgi:hypothetical protein
VVAPYFPLRSLSHLPLRKPMTRTRHREAGPLVFLTWQPGALDLCWLAGWSEARDHHYVPQYLLPRLAGWQGVPGGLPTCRWPEAKTGPGTVLSYLVRGHEQSR